MRVMVFSIADEAAERGVPPTSEAFAAMDRFTEELVEAGVLIAAAGFKPTSLGNRILFDGPERTVIDGPFTETKEVIAGFSIWEVEDMAEAVAWAKRSPNVSGQVEIRPFLEPEDLAAFLTPEELATPRDGERGRLGVA